MGTALHELKPEENKATDVGTETERETRGWYCVRRQSVGRLMWAGRGY